MIIRINGKLSSVLEDQIALEVGAFEYQILIPELVRRQIQGLVGEEIALHTMQYLEGNPMQGRLLPRLIGFLSEAEREFFDLFCSVDGVGVRKALKAMVRPVKEIAVAIQQQDKGVLSTLPGIGEATAERIIAKLRRKVPKFALIVESDEGQPSADAQPDLVQDAFAALLSVGHSEPEARQLLDQALGSRKKFKNATDVLNEIFSQIPPT